MLERNDRRDDRDGRRQQEVVEDTCIPGSSSKQYNLEIDTAVGGSDSYVSLHGRSHSCGRERVRNGASGRHWVSNRKYSNDHERRHDGGASPPQAPRLSSPPTYTIQSRTAPPGTFEILSQEMADINAQPQMTLS